VIQLDTSFVIRAMVSGTGEDRLLRRWLASHRGVTISAIAWTEFRCGPVAGPVVDLVQRIVGEPLPFSAAEAIIAASLFDRTGRRRGSLIDCMVAATAINAGDSLATSNLADFRRFETLGLELAGG
jgi:predicted nucleic acid-binding protein